MDKIFVLGAGCWGSTLAYLYSKKGINVTLWEPIEELKSFLDKYRHPRFFDFIRLPNDVKITNKIEDIKDFKLVLVVVPSKYLIETLKKLKATGFNFKDKIFVSCIKGFDIHSLKRPSEVIRDFLNLNEDNIFVLSGPSHAEEVALRKPTAVVLASKNEKFLVKLQYILNTNNFRIYAATDIIGVELGGALKNIYAIACGVCDGLNLGNNAKASLITRSLKEIITLGEIFKAEKKTFYGLSGLGDLLTTAYSNYSRNRNFGEYIVKTKSIQKAIKKVKTTIEGYYTVKVVYKLSKIHSLNLPIAEEVYNIIYNNKSPKESVENLLSRKLKFEFEGYNI